MTGEASWMKLMLDNVVALFAGLHYLTIEMRMNLLDAELYMRPFIKGDRSGPLDFFTLNIGPIYGDVKVQRRLVVISDLFEMHGPLIGDDDLAREMNRSDENQILYHATPEEDGYEGWYGMALSTYEAGRCDYEALVAAAQVQIGK